MATSRRRILVAVEPIVLEGALASILERVDLDDVVQFHRSPDRDVDGYDAAIVTIELPDDLRPDVVITLPDTVGDQRAGRLTVGNVSTEVDIPTHNEVIDLLDEQLPAAGLRSRRLHGLSDPA